MNINIIISNSNLYAAVGLGVLAPDGNLSGRQCKIVAPLLILCNDYCDSYNNYLVWYFI